MPLNLQGFVSEPNQWAGLYQAASALEKRQLKADQLALQQQAKRNAAGTFLSQYLDPKDYLTGTQFDPMILQGLQEAMQQGSKLAASGADSPMLMMALGPMVNKLTKYSTNAKNINKQVDDQISKLKESGYTGYDYAKLRENALKSAFYKQDPDGKLQLDPDKADPSVDWVSKTIQESPELVTSVRGWEDFANKAKTKTETHSVEDYDRFGTKDKVDVNLTFQEYMQPEWEGKKVKGFAPKYTMAFDGGQPLMHTFTDEAGKPVREQVRLLDKSIYEGLSEDLRADLRGKVKTELKNYETATGKKISPNSQQAQMIEQALAYRELNRPQRNYGKIGEKIISNKPSSQMINVNVEGTQQYQDNLRTKEEIKADVRDKHKTLKSNPIETIGEIANGNPEYLGGVKGPYGIEVTEVFPSGGLKAGRGQNFSYRKIFFDPANRQFTVEKENKQDFLGRKVTTTETIPENEVGKFIYRIGEANGIGYSKIKELLKKIGYEGGRFKNATNIQPQLDFEERAKGVQGWRQTVTQPFGQSF